MNNIETIDGIKGEWLTVTKASEVTVGQRVRYERESRFGYKIPHVITGIKNNEAGTKGDGWDRNIFNGYWTKIEAFFPLPAKRKVADGDSDCTNTSCRFNDHTMAQNCARCVSGENDEPYATICPRKNKRKVAKRPTKHERLLKALLKSAKTGENCGGKFIYFVEYPFITKEERKQLIAIKEAMEKKGGKS
jgi:hypothetical protein